MSDESQQVRAEIKRLKEKKNAVVLVHNYQRPEVQEIADHLGDSLGLSRAAAETGAERIVFCGVSFMAETAKILSPEKKVLLPRPAAEVDCPMAGMVNAKQLRALKEEHPGASVVAYVNTTAAVKAEADVCCTSSNAVRVVRNLEAEKVIFVPDRNLAAYVGRFVDKEIIPWDGFCYVHDRITAEEVKKAREKLPEAELVVHPECKPEVIDTADAAESTGGMVTLARQSGEATYLIGTEEGIVHRLRQEGPDKEFYTAGKPRICEGMKCTGLDDVLASLEQDQFEVELSPETVRAARAALDRMLDYA